MASVAIGGAIGSILRYLVQVQAAEWFASDFPYGTLIVNVLGSLLIGFLSFVLIGRFSVTEEVRVAILVGVLGGFTTFSTFSIETLALVEQGSFIPAMGNIILNIVLCLAACFLGMSLAKSL